MELGQARTNFNVWKKKTKEVAKREREKRSIIHFRSLESREGGIEVLRPIGNESELYLFGREEVS